MASGVQGWALPPAGLSPTCSQGGQERCADSPLPRELPAGESKDQTSSCTPEVAEAVG